MILTGSEIRRQRARGAITFEPFSPESINPNSCNYRLGPYLKVFESTDGRNNHRYRTITIPEEGYVLEPQRLYLGHTLEVIGSHQFAMSLIGRSSIGRLGLFLQVSANLGHTASCHQWTLELVCARPIRIYPRMRIGQVSFWTNAGEIVPYAGRYGARNLPTESRLPASYGGPSLEPGAPGERRAAGEGS
ncbi:dCTP deaminase [Actinoallomurus acaciae]|uniref:dCTP deaminase n=1 Tax=Actinoallomurus acaciae TaxID=502577 RepID=A0ABV5YQJ6_9ACTN